MPSKGCDQAAMRLDARLCRLHLRHKCEQCCMSGVEHGVIGAIAGDLAVIIFQQYTRTAQCAFSLRQVGCFCERLAQSRTPSRKIVFMSPGFVNSSGWFSSSSQSGRASTSTPVSSKTSKAIPAISRAAEVRSPRAPCRTTAISASLSALWPPLARLPNKMACLTKWRPSSRSRNARAARSVSASSCGNAGIESDAGAAELWPFIDTAAGP